MKPLLVAALAAALVSAAPAPSPLVARLIADARGVSETSHGFERTTRIEAEGKTTTRVERYDPARQPGWALVSVDGAAPSTKAAREYAKDGAGQRVPHYGRVALLLEGGAAPVEGDATRLRVAPLPDAVLKSTGMGSSFGRHLEAELTVADGARPYVSRVRFFAPKPFRMMLVAKVDRFEAVNSYAPGADGRPRVVAQTTLTAGSMPGRSGTVVTRSTYRPL